MNSMRALRNRRKFLLNISTKVNVVGYRNKIGQERKYMIFVSTYRKSC